MDMLYNLFYLPTSLCDWIKSLPPSASPKGFPKEACMFPSSICTSHTCLNSSSLPCACTCLSVCLSLSLFFFLFYLWLMHLCCKTTAICFEHTYCNFLLQEPKSTACDRFDEIAAKKYLWKIASDGSRRACACVNNAAADKCWRMWVECC